MGCNIIGRRRSRDSRIDAHSIRCPLIQKGIVGSVDGIDRIEHRSLDHRDVSTHPGRFRRKSRPWNGIIGHTPPVPYYIQNSRVPLMDNVSYPNG